MWPVVVLWLPGAGRELYMINVCWARIGPMMDYPELRPMSGSDTAWTVFHQLALLCCLLLTSTGAFLSETNQPCLKNVITLVFGDI